MSLQHLIYNYKTFAYAGTVPVVKNDPAGNSGLPDWFFEGDFTNFEVDEDADTIEWVPPVGPAPIWNAKYSEVKHALWDQFTKWYDETY